MNGMAKLGALIYVIVSYFMFIMGFVCSKYSESINFQHIILVLLMLGIIIKGVSFILSFFIDVKDIDN